MNLKILLPFKVFAEKTGVSRIVVDTCSGSYGLLPHRLDCSTALVPGILVYENEEDGEVFIGVDEGVMVKIGSDVFVSVRNAIGGENLEELQEAVQQEFMKIDEEEQDVRIVMGKMETDFIRRLKEFHHE